MTTTRSMTGFPATMILSAVVFDGVTEAPIGRVACDGRWIEGEHA